MSPGRGKGEALQCQDVQRAVGEPGGTGSKVGRETVPQSLRRLEQCWPGQLLQEEGGQTAMLDESLCSSDVK